MIECLTKPVLNQIRCNLTTFLTRRACVSYVMPSYATDPECYVYSRQNRWCDSKDGYISHIELSVVNVATKMITVNSELIVFKYGLTLHFVFVVLHDEHRLLDLFLFSNIIKEIQLITNTYLQYNQLEGYLTRYCGNHR